MKSIPLILCLILTGCRTTRQLDADERAIVEHTRDAQSAGEMLLMLNAWREMGMTP